MKRFYSKVVAAMLMALGGSISMAPANAAPPTVTPSPGYDARLQESRAAKTVVEPVAPVSKPVTPRLICSLKNSGVHVLMGSAVIKIRALGR